MSRIGGGKSGMFVFALVFLLVESFALGGQLSGFNSAYANFQHIEQQPEPSAPSGCSGWLSLSCNPLSSTFSSIVFAGLTVAFYMWKFIVLIFFPVDLIGVMIAFTISENIVLGGLNVFLVAILIYSILPMV